MLRRKISAGALRVASPKSTLTSNVPGQLIRQQQGQTQQASLVSAVLLNSQRRWKEETVVGLKSELKRRGLSQTGNKSALISRLESNDTSSFLPPVPALPAHLSKRTLSTSSPRPDSAPKSPVKPEGAAQAPISTETINSTGPAVISQKMEAPKTEEIEAEIVDAVPGLPEIADMETKGTSGERRKVNMPQFDEEPEIEQTIPLEPDNFRSNRQLPEADSPSPAQDLPAGPKVITVSDPSTLPGGGPSHAGFDDLPVSEPAESKSPADEASEAAAKLYESLPSLTTVLSSVALSPLRGVHSLAKVLPPIGKPSGELKEENKQYKANSEPLSGNEKQGMYIFGGIVALGLALGGDWPDLRGVKARKGSSKDAKSESGHGAAAGSGAAAGVKGDAEWEKASGANVVGHGNRKA